MIELELPLPPSDNDLNGYCVKRGRVVVYRKKKTKEFYAKVFIIVKAAKVTMMTNRCRAKMVFHIKSKLRDGHNCHKALFDALEEAGAVENDRLIKEWSGVVINKSVKENKVFLKLIEINT